MYEIEHDNSVLLEIVTEFEVLLASDNTLSFVLSCSVM